MKTTDNIILKILMTDQGKGNCAYYVKSRHVQKICQYVKNVFSKSWYTHRTKSEVQGNFEYCLMKIKKILDIDLAHFF